MIVLVSKARNAVGRAKGYGGCHRCGGTWDYTQEHITHYGDEGRGCFPLCEACWSELTIEDRLPYYRGLWERWESGGEGYADWGQIEASVRMGL